MSGGLLRLWIECFVWGAQSERLLGIGRLPGRVRYILPILGLDVTIGDLAHPESEDSEPFIIRVPEFLQPVISYETQAAALMGNSATARLLVGSGMEMSSYT